MTSLFRHKSSRGGFTLVELLVVIGIIVLLISILLPMVNRAYRESIRASMAADLQVISEALEAYRHDFGDYPRPSGQADGAVILCWALVAPGPQPQDGHQGPGFTIRGPGDVKGPYLPADRFRIGKQDGNGIVSTDSNPSDYVDVLADRYNRPILYFVANNSVSPNIANGFVSKYGIGTLPAQSVFNYNDNAAYARRNTNNDKLTLNIMLFRLGDTNQNGMIDGALGETAVTTGPYILWSAGPDGFFGTDDDVANVPLNTPLRSDTKQ